MTLLSHYYKNEPILNIGIILPHDERKKVCFSFENRKNYEIKHRDSKTGHPAENQTISIDDGDLEITKINENENSTGITIHDVPTGRNFHWKKWIEVILPGNIQVKRYEDCLLIINEVKLEDYLACVAVSEMSSQCPTEFLKAQTISARSWILARAEKKHFDLGIDACNDDCCQRYQGIEQQNLHSLETVKTTHGLVLTHGNNICDARYSKSCGGFTENCENVWDMEPKPYLKSILDGMDKYHKVDWEKWITQSPHTFCSPKFMNEKPISNYLGNVDEKHEYFRWKVRFTQLEFCEFFSKIVNQQVSQINRMNVLNRGKSGRIIQLNLEYQMENGSENSLKLHNEYDIRKTLHPSFLFSSAFIPNVNKTHIEFIGAGWGHGVGMCQIGALGMSLNGYSSSEILSHYFQNSSLKKLY